MKKYFNVVADCKPENHYMVDIQKRLVQIKAMVDKGEYFTMNRARQYGKTTTLKALKKVLVQDYIVIAMDFQFLSQEDFRDEFAFTQSFTDELICILKNTEGINENVLKRLDMLSSTAGRKNSLSKLFAGLKYLCESVSKPVVMMIDEVDSASNNQVFLDFLAQLRGGYIHRDERKTFHSVILAGVYDIKNLKGKIRSEEEHKTNSPWKTREGNEENERLRSFDDCPRDYREFSPYNIATEFDVDMSFSVEDICGMLSEYEKDHHTGMNILEISMMIYEYTSGYPFLVSRICKYLDETVARKEEYSDLSMVWTKKGFLEAIRLLLSEKNTLFESLVNKMKAYPKLRDMLYAMLFQGSCFVYNPLNQEIELAAMFGLITNKDGMVVVSNRIFETILYNLFISEDIMNSSIYRKAVHDKNGFVQDGYLNMDLILKKFVEHFSDLYRDYDDKFIEDSGRRLFLLYLKPIINGTGNYYIESRTRDSGRTDVIVDYLGKQYIIELKIWHGEEYNRRGEEQLGNYLDAYHQKKGYMISFNFNKNKKIGLKLVKSGNKEILEAVV